MRFCIILLSFLIFVCDLVRGVTNNFVIDGTNGLAVALLQATSDDNRNRMFSPIEYSIQLAILSEGARDKTQEEIRRFLRFPDDITGARKKYHDVILELAKSENRGARLQHWIRVQDNFTLQEDFEDILRTFYLTEKGTGHKFREMTKKFDEHENQRQADEVTTDEDQAKSNDDSVDTDGCLRFGGRNPDWNIIGGLRLSRKWKYPLRDTLEEDRIEFYNGKEKTKVTTAQTEGEFNSGSVPELNSTVVELTAETDNGYSLLLLIPDVGNTVGKLVSDLSGYSLTQLYQHVNKKQMKIKMPVFTILGVFNAKPVLEKIGISKLFTREEADLSGITTKEGVYVKEFQQYDSFRMAFRSFLGTESVGSSFGSKRNELEELVVDRPFLLFVLDRETGLVLGAGKVVSVY